jgi:hypothetical protein
MAALIGAAMTLDQLDALHEALRHPTIAGRVTVREAMELATSALAYAHSVDGRLTEALDQLDALTDGDGVPSGGVGAAQYNDPTDIGEPDETGDGE